MKVYLHNVLICHDLLRHYNRQTSTRCLRKINLMKAYDMVNWKFVQEALCGYEFPKRFTEYVMACITSPSFIVKINGEGYGFFAGKRELRQGDLMSPLIYIFVMEYIYRTLKCMSNL